MGSTELYILVELAVLSNIIMLASRESWLNVAGSVWAMIMWFMVALYWGIEYAETDTFQFMLVFVGLGVITGALGAIEIIRKMFSPYRGAPGYEDDW